MKMKTIYFVLFNCIAYRLSLKLPFPIDHTISTNTNYSQKYPPYHQKYPPYLQKKKSQLRLYRAQRKVFTMRIVVHPDSSTKRNRILCAMLMLFGLIQFSCTVRHASGDTKYELWASASFFTMVGACIALVLTTIGNDNKYAKLAAALILFIACVLCIATGGYWTKNECDDKAHCGAQIFGKEFILPAMVIIVVAVDLYISWMTMRRVRIIVLSVIVFTTSILMCAYYYDTSISDLSSADKVSASGHTVLMAGSAFTFLVHGVFGCKSVKAFNIGSACILYFGLGLLLSDDDVCSSNTLVWWFLLSSVVFLIVADVQDGELFERYQDPEHGYSKVERNDDADKKKDVERSKSSERTKRQMSDL